MQLKAKKKLKKMAAEKTASLSFNGICTSIEALHLTLQPGPPATEIALQVLAAGEGGRERGGRGGGRVGVKG